VFGSIVKCQRFVNIVVHFIRARNWYSIKLP